MRSDLLVQRWPAFAAELETLLTCSSEPQLAGSVGALRVVAHCACGDDFCQTFYTAPPPEGSYPDGVYSVQLDPQVGMINVDVLGGRILCIEALWREDLRR